MLLNLNTIFLIVLKVSRLVTMFASGCADVRRFGRGSETVQFHQGIRGALAIDFDLKRNQKLPTVLKSP